MLKIGELEILKLLKKIALTGMSRGVTAAGTFAINVLLAWQLEGIGEYGQFAVCMTAITVLSIFSRFGADVALLRFGGAAWHMGDVDAYRNYIRRTLTVALAISVSLVLGGELILAFVGELWESSRTMQYLLPSLPFLACSFAIGAAFKTAQRPELGSLFEIGGGSLVACLCFLVWSGLGKQLTPANAAVLFTCASVIFWLMAVVALTQTVWKKTKPAEWQPVEQVGWKQYFWTSSDFALIAGAQVIGNWCGLFFLELWGESAEVGGFSAAMRVAMLPMLLQNIVVTIASPRLAGLHEQRDEQSLRTLVGRASLLLFASTFPVLVLLSVAAPWALAIFGSEYRHAWPLLSIVAAGQLVGTVTGISTAVMGMVGEQRLIRKIGLISSCVSILLSAALTFQFGATGAALAAASYATTQALLVAIAAWHKLGFATLPTIPRHFTRWLFAIVPSKG